MSKKLLLFGHLLPIAEKGIYDNKNLVMTKSISAWKAYNRNVIEEAQQLGNNIEMTKNMVFPSTLPVLMFTTKEDKINEEWKTNITFYQDQLKNQKISKLIPLEGHHYLHWTQFKEMSKQVDDFIESYSNTL
ncbi:hypothetical protein [Lysinibacillus endophyticus]|uniref:hypothetical protein n=1 Tax=Ureibacillus endophyticus TaxID=1978490 RepID=UPI003135252F